MGIDVYLRWEGQTEAEQQAQYTGWSNTAGNVGYLREACHGGPYVTQILLPEGFEEEPKCTVCGQTYDDNEAHTKEEHEFDHSVEIPFDTLVKRLPKAIEAGKERARAVYKEELDDKDPVLQAFRDFVMMVGRLEKDGKKPRILVSW